MEMSCPFSRPHKGCTIPTFSKSQILGAFNVPQKERVTLTWLSVSRQVQPQVWGQVPGQERVSLNYTDWGTCNKKGRVGAMLLHNTMYKDPSPKYLFCSYDIKRTLNRLLTGFWFSSQKLWSLEPSSSSAPGSRMTDGSVNSKHLWCVSRHFGCFSVYDIPICSITWKRACFCSFVMSWKSHVLLLSPAAFCTREEGRKPQSQL